MWIEKGSAGLHGKTWLIHLSELIFIFFYDLGIDLGTQFWYTKIGQKWFIDKYNPYSHFKNYLSEYVKLKVWAWVLNRWLGSPESVGLPRRNSLS